MSIERRLLAGLPRPATPADSAAERIWADATASVLQSGYHDCEPDWELKDRTRPHAQVWLFVGGRGTMTVGLTQYAVSAGTALLIPPHVPHRGIHDPHRPLRCYVLHYTLRVLGAAVPDASRPLPPLVRPSPAIWPEVAADAACITREMQEMRGGYALIASGTMSRLLGLLWREATTGPATSSRTMATTTGTTATTGAGHQAMASGVPSSGETAQSWDDPRLATVLAHVAAHFRRPLSLPELAGLVHLSPAHFSTMFRRATGLSPLQYVHRYRWQRAKEMLVGSDASVAEIAAAVGVPDPFYFSRAFKRTEGISPQQYRAARKGTL